MARKSTFLEEHPTLRTLIYMLAVTAVILIVVFNILKLYGRTGREYEMPELIGMTIDDAESDNDLGIRFEVIDTVYEEGDEGGRILTQDPKAGSKIKKGRTVFVSITASSPDNAVMPDLADMTVRQAVSQLSSLGFKVGRLKFVQSQFRNVVLEATCRGHLVNPGSSMSGGSVIDLVVGMSPEHPYGVIPFVLGKSPEKARRDMKAGSFNVGTEHFENVTDRAKAVVIRQSPAYTGVSQNQLGTYVELWYSDDPKLDVDKIVNDYEVDPSQIISPEMLEGTQPKEEEVVTDPYYDDEPQW